MGRPSFCTFSAAFVCIFRYLLKYCLLQIFNKILEKWLYLILDIGKYMKNIIFMIQRIYIANSRSVWVHPINSLCMQKGEFYTLYPDLRHFQSKFFFTYPMNPQKFNRLLTLIGPEIQKKWTKF